MPKLLNSGEVQLHMPRTGGRSLAKQIGVKKIVGTMHDGPGQIPQEWSDYPTVATFRDPISWKQSMYDYLKRLELKNPYENFLLSVPNQCEFGDIDPTFNLWADPERCFLKFIIERNFKSWYEAFASYFLTPADRIVPIHKLKVHRVEPK